MHIAQYLIISRANTSATNGVLLQSRHGGSSLRRSVGVWLNCIAKRSLSSPIGLLVARTTSSDTSGGILSWFGNIKAPACVPINTTSNTPPQSEFFDSTKQSTIERIMQYHTLALLYFLGSLVLVWTSGKLYRRRAVSKFTVLNDLPTLGTPRLDGTKLGNTAIICGGRYIFVVVDTE
jgi:hypothetical protein